MKKHLFFLLFLVSCCLFTQELTAQKYFKSRIYDAKEDELSSGEEGGSNKKSKNGNSLEYVQLSGKKYRYVTTMDSSLVGRKVTYRDGYYTMSNPRIAFNYPVMKKYGDVIQCNSMKGVKTKVILIKSTATVAGICTGVLAFTVYARNTAAEDRNALHYLGLGAATAFLIPGFQYLGDLWSDKIYENVAKNYNNCLKTRKKKKKVAILLPSSINIIPTVQPQGGGAIVGLRWKL